MDPSKDITIEEKIGVNSGFLSHTITGIQQATSFFDVDAVLSDFLSKLKNTKTVRKIKNARDESTDFGLKLKGKKTRERINNQIKEIVESVNAPEDLSEEQLDLLKQYSGNGGLSNNSLFEYYTPTFIAQGMWDLMKENGFESGNVLEPSTGAGVFSATKNESTLMTGAEIDPVSSKVNQLLHPEDQINNMPFEELNNQTPDGSFDSVVGNVPFGNSRGKYQWMDKQYDKIKKIEYYFIHRSIDKCKPGGLICLVCPTGVLNNKGKKDVQFRYEISKKAEFLGAHKLPSKTFKDQGTPVVTDILVFKKHTKDLIGKIEDYKLEDLEEAQVYFDEFIHGKYWQGEGKRFIHGKLSHDSFRGSEIVDSDIDNESLKKKLAIKFNSRIDWDLLTLKEPELKNYIEGDRKYINGKEYEFIGGSWQEVEQAPDEIVALDKDQYGCANLAELKGILNGEIENSLQLTYDQALNTYLAFPDILTPLQKEAIETAMKDENLYKEELYKGVILGGMVGKLQYKVSEGHEDADIYRAMVQNAITLQLDKSNLPINNKKLLKEGSTSKAFGMYANAVRNDGSWSDLLEGKLEKAIDSLQYDSESLEAIVEHLYERELIRNISIEDIQGLYTGEKDLERLEDLANERNIAITPDGFIEPMQRFISGDIYPKIKALYDAIAEESSPKLKDKYQEEIDAIKKNRKSTAVEDISFTLNQKWIPKKYILDFLNTTDLKECDFAYGEVVEEEFRNPHTDEITKQTVFKKDLEAVFGEWRISSYRTGFNNQFVKYLNGKKVGGKKTQNKETKEEVDNKKEYSEKIKSLNEEFQAYMENHPSVMEVQELFNQKFNSYTEFEYSSEPLDLSGYSSGLIKPHGYQAQAIRRLSEEGRGILGFDVGLGKTFTALGLHAENMKKKRSKRTCIVVPNAVLANWYHDSRTFLGDLSKALFVGFSVKEDKNGKPVTEEVLDEKGKGTGKFQDVLKSDSAEEKFNKAHSIPQSNYSLVVMTKDFYKTIPLKPETKQRFLEKQVDKGRISEKQAADTAKGGAKKGDKRSYQEALQDEIRANQASKDFDRADELPYWEDMGFDTVIVDEAHEFKNSYQPKDMQGIAYLPTAPSSQRAMDMNIKLDHLKDMNGGRGAIMLSATPVTNSPFEIYNMISMVAPPEEMEKFGVYTVDDFINVFGKIDIVEKLMTSGDVKSMDGLVGFKQLDGLRSLFHKYTNLKKASDVTGFELPPHETVQEVVELTGEQQDIYDTLKEEALEATKKKKAPGTRHVFAVLRDMDKIASDPDLYFKMMTFLYPIGEKEKVEKALAALPEKITQKTREWDEEKGRFVVVKEDIVLNELLRIDENSDTFIVGVPDVYEKELVSQHSKCKVDETKVSHPVTPKYAKLIDNLKKEYETKGKQIIFTEEKSQHNKIYRLISHNVPVERKQVAIINADTAKGDQIQTISDEYNRGTLKIIIANKKAEVGVNLQKGTTAIHHLTYPWTPASIQQRNGRGLRQGNKAKHINIYYYNAKHSIDEYRLDVLDSKSNWINELLTGNDSEVVNGDADDKDDLEIMMSDNPEEARRKKAEKKAIALKKEQEKIKRKLFNNLRQIGLLGEELKDFDNIKLKKKEELEKDLEKLKEKLEKDEKRLEKKIERDEPETNLKLTRGAISSGKAKIEDKKRELNNLDSKFEVLRKEKETRLNTLKNTLKKKKDILPFDVALVDQADNIVLSNSGIAFKKAGMYEVDRGGRIGLYKITELNVPNKAFKYDFIAGETAPLHSIKLDESYSWYSIEEFARHKPYEVSYTEEELSLKKVLSEQQEYAEIHKTISKEVFVDNVHKIQFYANIAFYRTANGELAYTDEWRTLSEDEKKQGVYPEPEKESFKSEIFKYYLKVNKDDSFYMGYWFAQTMKDLFGGDWKIQAAEYGNKITQAEMTEIVKPIWENQKTEIEGWIEEGRSMYSVWSDLKTALREALEKKGDNPKDEFEQFVVVYVQGLQEWFEQKQAEAQTEKERAELEALKSNPNYKEIPFNVVEKFSDMEVVIKVNTETVRGRAGGARTFEPFEAWLLQDENYKGPIYHQKNQIKKWGGKFFKDEGAYSGAWWAVPADEVTLEDIYQYISERV